METKSRSLLQRLAVLVGLVCVTAACPESKPPETPAQVAAPTPTAGTTTPTDNARKAVGTNVTVDAEIFQACHLDAATEVAATPKFAFDESVITRADALVLDKIATCLTTGPLAGRHVMLTGRADPRGNEEYNLSLGAKRAHGVAKYLEQLGVSTAHVNETSRGALDATGSDEAAWAVDRRVDISLMKS